MHRDEVKEICYITERTLTVAGCEGSSFHYNYLKGMRVKCDTVRSDYSVST